eukprot:81955-Hanusia_phi.AAC.3
MSPFAPCLDDIPNQGPWGLPQAIHSQLRWMIAQGIIDEHELMVELQKEIVMEMLRDTKRCVPLLLLKDYEKGLQQQQQQQHKKPPSSSKTADQTSAATKCKGEWLGLRRYKDGTERDFGNIISDSGTRVRLQEVRCHKGYEKATW